MPVLRSQQADGRNVDLRGRLHAPAGIGQPALRQIGQRTRCAAGRIDIGLLRLERRKNQRGIQRVALIAVTGSKTAVDILPAKQGTDDGRRTAAAGSGNDGLACIRFVRRIGVGSNRRRKFCRHRRQTGQGQRRFGAALVWQGNGARLSGQ